MKPTCRAALCEELPQRLPEDMLFLGIDLCEAHANHLRAVAESATAGLEEYAMLVEARRLVDPPEGALPTALEGEHARR
jgi:hypothetical protein